MTVRALAYLFNKPTSAGTFVGSTGRRVEPLSGGVPAYRADLLTVSLVAGTGAVWWLVCSLWLRSLRVGLLLTWVGLGVFVVASTELLSLASLIGAPALVATWFCALAMGGWVLTRTWTGWTLLRPISRNARWLVLPGILLAVPLVVSVAAAPNNWDSMTYHLPRVAHWQAQGSVTFYATSIDRQLWMAPLSEFAAMHLMTLSGGDVLANLVQWAALGLTAVAASVLAQR